MTYCFGLHFFPLFKTCSSYTWQFYSHSQCTLDRCTRSRRCETSDTWMHPWIRRISYTGGWTCSHQSKPLCTCALCRWGRGRGHCCWEQTRFGGAAGSQFLGRRLGFHGVTAPLPQGRRRCSSSAGCRPPSAPWTGTEWARAAPPRCSWMWAGCRCNSEGCTYRHSRSTRPTGPRGTACTPYSRGSSLLQAGTGRAPEWGICSHRWHRVLCYSSGTRGDTAGTSGRLELAQYSVTSWFFKEVTQ